MQPELPSAVPARAPRTLYVILLGLVLAFGFLGTRGIWDPDEGRYTNVALTMLDSGNWIDPMRNEDVGHWTKPPMTYWLIAGSVAVLDHTPWAARLPVALSYLACMLLAWLIARHVAKGAEDMAAVVYATMLLPFAAGQLVTTDFVLAATQTLAMYGFVRYRFGTSGAPQSGLLLMWLGLALGFMTKGPPALIPLLVIGVLHGLAPGPRPVRWPWHLAGIVLFLLLALPWYVYVVVRHDGLMAYFLGAELVDRVASDRFQRNGEWYGWLKIYLPTLLIGTLPWTWGAWRWLRSLPPMLGTFRNRAARKERAAELFLALWVFVPLLVFCVARSRLPLYLLPIFVPLAVAIAATRMANGLGWPRWRWLLFWVVLLLGLRLAAAHFPTHKDASVWADAIRERVPGTVSEVIFVEDMARYGLHLHLGVEVEKVSRELPPQARFNPSYDEALWGEVKETGLEEGLVFIAKQAIWDDVERAINRHGYQARAMGTPFEGRIIFEVLPPSGTSGADVPMEAKSTPVGDLRQ